MGLWVVYRGVGLLTVPQEIGWGQLCRKWDSRPRSSRLLGPLSLSLSVSVSVSVSLSLRFLILFLGRRSEYYTLPVQVIHF